MINRKIALSAMSILTALGMTAGATFAVFTSQATSTGNTFSSGNANLQISDDSSQALGGTPSGFVASIAGPSFGGMFPGDERDQFFWLKNSSSAAINLATTADVANLSATGTLFGDNLLVKWACDLNNDNQFGGSEISSEFSVNAWFTGGNATVGTLASGQEVECAMMTRIPETADSGIATQSLSFNSIYDATQTP